MALRVCRECGLKFHPFIRGSVVCDDCAAEPVDPEARQRLQEKQQACGHPMEGWIEDPRHGTFECGACGLPMDLHFEQEGWAERVRQLVAAREKARLRQGEMTGAKHA